MPYFVIASYVAFVDTLYATLFVHYLAGVLILKSKYTSSHTHLHYADNNYAEISGTDEGALVWKQYMGIPGTEVVRSLTRF